jgi:hypothetical protein
MRRHEGGRAHNVAVESGVDHLIKTAIGAAHSTMQGFAGDGNDRCRCWTFGVSSRVSMPITTRRWTCSDNGGQIENGSPRAVNDAASSRSFSADGNPQVSLREATSSQAEVRLVTLMATFRKTSTQR